MSLIIEGEMGKGGSTPIETKDTLVSEQTAKLLFVVGEGIIESVDNVYLDTVSISNFDATSVTRTGTPSQTVIPGFVVTEAPLPTFSSIVIERGTTKTPANEPPGFQANWYYATIPFDVDAARLTFLISVLSYLDPDGNLVGSKVQFEIWTQANNSATWVLAGTINKKGKTTHGYTFDVQIERPALAISTSPWNIRVRRITPDSGSSKKQNTINWSAVTQLYYSSTKYDNTYPNTALVGVTINDAKQFGSRIPEIMFRVKGRQVRIPNNYNPVTRVYTGTWTGSFALAYAYTNNPAFILLDVLTDTRAGLSISLSDVDIYSIYNLGKYADETISDGYGGTIPRYTLDYQFLNRGSVQDFISQVLSICNANLIINEFGQLSVIFQKPGQAVVRNITNANVVEGSFTYQSSDIEKRTNLVNVTYNNGLNFGRTDTVTVQDDASITRYGLQPVDVVLPGCLYEAQAIRKARWVLYTNCYFTNIISFSVFLDGLIYKIGDLVRVFDNYNQDSQQAGLITACASGATTTLTFDRSITLASGSFTFYCYDINGAEVTKAVTGPATLSSIAISSNITVNPNSVFIFSGTVAGKLYRIMSIDKSDDSVYAITGAEFNDNIFTYIDQSILLSAGTNDFANLSNLGTVPVETIFIAENFGTNGVYTNGRLQVSWTWDSAKTQKYQARFKLTWVVDDGIVNIINDINSDTFDILDPKPGTYTITIWAINPFTGISSTAVVYTYGFRTGGGVSTLNPPVNVRITGTSVVTPQPTSLNFATQDLSLTFEYNPLNTNVADALYDYVVEIYDQTATTLVSTYSVLPYAAPALPDPIDSSMTYIPLNGLFLFPFTENTNVFSGTPNRTFVVKIYSRDTLGDKSTAIAVQVTNPVPAFTALTLFSDLGKVIANITASTESDVANYLVHRGTTSGFTPDGTNIVYRGKSNNVSIPTPDNNSYYYKAAISDNFGETGLSYSSGVAGSSLNASVDTYTYTGLVFKPNDPSTNSVSWTSFVATKNGTTSVTVAAGNVAWTTGILYLYYIPGNTTLQTTTALATAVSGRILATYKGGTDLTSDEGRAFTSGDMILAGTVGSNQLVTGTAVITQMAQIGNILQSDNYSASGTYAGWRLDKTGTLYANAIDIRNTSGGVIFQTGTGFNWNNVTGTNVPAANATRNVFRGAWATATTYAVGDIVIDSLGYGWSCITAHTSSAGATTPVYPVTSNTNWTLYTVKGDTGAQGTSGPTVIISCNRSPVFTATDNVLNAFLSEEKGNNAVNSEAGTPFDIENITDIGVQTLTFTATTYNMTGQTYAWTVSLDGGTATSLGTASTATLSASTFGTTKQAQVKCTVTYNSVAYVDTINVTKLDSSTANAGATLGAEFDVNVKGQITSGNISTYIQSAAITDAYIGSLHAAKIINNTLIKSRGLKGGTATSPSSGSQSVIATLSFDLAHRDINDFIVININASCDAGNLWTLNFGVQLDTYYIWDTGLSQYVQYIWPIYQSTAIADCRSLAGSMTLTGKYIGNTFVDIFTYLGDIIITGPTVNLKLYHRQQSGSAASISDIVLQAWDIYA